MNRIVLIFVLFTNNPVSYDNVQIYNEPEQGDKIFMDYWDIMIM